MTETLTEFNLCTVVVSRDDARVDAPTAALYNGPFFPEIVSGLMRLNTTVTAKRFLVASGLWKLDDGAAGLHLAFKRKIAFQNKHPDRFVLFVPI